MARTLIQQLADFTLEVRFDQLPPEVVSEGKRALLDSVGCAVAGLDQPKGKAAIKYGHMLGGPGGTAGTATLMGTGEQVTVYGAAFANAELINTLDMDAVLPPGHVTPYVLPGALAMAELIGVCGKRLIEALAVAHEMSFRFGRAMDNQRDTDGGVLRKLKVFGYASTIFGATAAVGRVRDLSADTLANALAIAAYITPVNPQIAFFAHPPTPTIKYLAAGVMAQQALTASFLGELGHHGDLKVLDDAEFGYRAYIGTEKWEPQHLTDRLGEEWLFPPFASYKLYPHCRIMHASMDCLIDLVRRNALNPDEIDAIKVYVEGFAEKPIWLNRTIRDANDAQFSMAHGIAVAAHLIPPGKAWMDPALIHNPSVMRLMCKVSTEVHPDYVSLLTSHSASRPAWIEVKARGQTFTAEKRYPKGSPSPDPETRMTDEELIGKFLSNVGDVVSSKDATAFADTVMNLETVSDLGPLMRRLAPARNEHKARLVAAS